jgi:hypothetical protein
MATNPLIDLDFDQIKTAIIDYIKNSNSTFTDYNFEGSALNSIIDILAYNTHTNAYYANMLHSESFLDTAQKRSSVVSRAKELGYTPKSITGSNAYINIYTTGLSSQSTVFYIPRGSVFTSSNESGSYQFLAKNDYFSKLDGVNGTGNRHIFSDVNLISGVYLSNSFTVDILSNVRSIFTIPNESIDTNTLRVFVKDSANSVERTEYKLASNVFDAERGSLIYYLQESYTGNFEIFFGDNILGKQPVNGNVIEIDYFASEMPDSPNGCRFFASDITFDGGVGVASIETTQVAFGGSYKDPLETIRFNALNTNISKNRAVTASDYSTLLISNFSFIKSVNSWGGEDNLPPVFGKIFLSLQPVTGFTISDSVKNSQILPVIKKNSLVTITPEFVDPAYTFLEFTTKAKYVKNRTLLTKSLIESYIRATISTYVSNISSFNSEYLHSQLIKECLAIDASISSVDIKVNIAKNIVPYIGVSTTSMFSFNNELTDGSITSTNYYMISNGETVLVSLKQIPGSYSDAINTIPFIGAYNSDNQLIRNVGTINLKTGEVNITINVSAFVTSTVKFVKLKATTYDLNISTKNNQILALDANLKDGPSGLIDNNYILVEEYLK